MWELRPVRVGKGLEVVGRGLQGIKGLCQTDQQYILRIDKANSKLTRIRIVMLSTEIAEERCV